MELGIYSFGDRPPDPFTGEQISVADRLAQTLERIKLADELGLGFSGSTASVSTRSGHGGDRTAGHAGPPAGSEGLRTRAERCRMNLSSAEFGLFGISRRVEAAPAVRVVSP